MSANTRKQQIEEMLAIDPDDSFLRYGLAMEYAGGGDDETAAKLLGKLMKDDADYVPAYLMAGQALLRLGRDEDARATLKTGIEAATRKGNDHAAGEMAGLLATLG